MEQQIQPELVSVIAKIMRERIAKKGSFRLGTIISLEDPSHPVEMAADEVYERSGLNALQFPDFTLARHYLENIGRLDGEFRTNSEYGIQNILD